VVFGLRKAIVLNSAVMLENVYQNEPLVEEPEQLSPVDQLRLQWNQQPGIPLLKQKSVIERCPELLSYVGMASLKGWSWPYAFAFQGLVIAAILASLLNWSTTHDSGKLHEEIDRLQAATQAEVQRQQGVSDATEAEISRISNSRKETFKLHMSDTLLTREQALAELKASLNDSRSSLEQYKQRMDRKEKDLQATEHALSLARSGAPLFFCLALLLCAGGVRRGVQSDYSRNRLARNSGDFFLYFATTEGIFLNLVLLAFAHFALSGGNYGLSDFFESVGPLFKVVFWIAFYILVLRYFVGIARGMYKALGLRVPASEWGFDNRILLRIHNNFLAVFAVMEGTFLAACYLLYHLDKRLF
jgi:hypothetical protein